MNYKKIIGLVLIALLAIFAIQTFKAKQAHSEQIKVGVISILSGEYAFVGENVRNGIVLASEDWNASHPDKQFSLVIEDDGFDAKKGVSAYKKLTSIDKVSAILNTSSPTIDAIYSDATKQNMPIIQFGNQGVEPTDDNVLQFTPGNSALEIALGKTVYDAHKQNIALVYGNDAVFKKFSSDFKKGYGATLQEYEVSTVGDDPRAIATRIKNQNPEAIVIISAPTSGAKIVKELSQMGVHAPYYFDANVQGGFGDYKRILGDISIRNGAKSMTLIDSRTPEFDSAYEKRFGVKPGLWSNWGYDGFMTLAKSYDSDGAKWTRNVKTISTSGVSGKISLDENGVVLPAYALKEIRSGEFVDVK